ncbi:hypothetical protein [Pedobacter frigidisoli]|uniref:cold-shock protein n=1 Tax=Pedobacter frigidisoli TaxID=2530455 RepID=UPI00292EC8B6|nr:hypothetical protein [Pedobacter frigidisoli]
MRKGIVILIDPVSDKGYIIDENEQDIPFLLSSLNKAVEVGDRVLFEITLSKSGLMAKNVLLNIQKSAINNGEQSSSQGIYISRKVPE